MAAVTEIATFTDRLNSAVEENHSLLCVGLDPDLDLLPAAYSYVREDPRAIAEFNAEVIAATVDLVCAYKPNLGFYLANGAAGVEALEATRRMIPRHIPVILDAKVGDIGSTATAYAAGYFDTWDFDAVTVNPYLGEDSLAPFLRRPDRGVIVVCKTSNPGSGDLQDLAVATASGPQSLAMTVADRVRDWSDRYPASLALVVGATYPDELAAVRGRCPDLPILLPGVGAQAGDLAASLAAGLDARGRGLIVNASRGVTYAGTGQEGRWSDHVRSAALALRHAINAARPS
ncbi:MAG: orotidine-5'-phosphate decarboxylase [Thermomicrobiales bacterium]